LFILVKEMTTAWLKRNMVIFLGLVWMMTNKRTERVTEGLTRTSNWTKVDTIGFDWQEVKKS
jgi:hypothetical protein